MAWRKHMDHQVPRSLRFALSQRLPRHCPTLSNVAFRRLLQHVLSCSTRRVIYSVAEPGASPTIAQAQDVHPLPTARCWNSMTLSFNSSCVVEIQISSSNDSVLHFIPFLCWCSSIEFILLTRSLVLSKQPPPMVEPCPIRTQNFHNVASNSKTRVRPLPSWCQYRGCLRSIRLPSQQCSSYVIAPFSSHCLV